MSEFEPERGSDAWHAMMAERHSIEPGSDAWHRAPQNARPERPWYLKKRTMIPAGVVGLVLLGGLISFPSPDIDNAGGTVVSVSSTGLDTAEQPMEFEECNRQIRTLAEQMGTPVNIVDSAIMRTVRFLASDGSVLVTCDALDHKMIVVKSPHRG